MRRNPKHNEKIIVRAVNGLRTLAPDGKFNGKGLAELAPQAARSLAVRQRLLEIKAMEIEQLALRDAEDEKSIKLIEQIVAGIIGHDDFGDDSALYEAFGFKRRSDRKSGLTRKKKKEVTPMP